jgi:hypothetical protein
MKKQYIWAIVCFTILIAGYYINQNRYVALVPLTLKNDVFTPTTLQPGEVADMKYILTFYGKSYKEQAGIIYIKNSLQNDEEIIWNYTTKAKRFKKGKVPSSKSIP